MNKPQSNLRVFKGQQRLNTSILCPFSFQKSFRYAGKAAKQHLGHEPTLMKLLPCYQLSCAPLTRNTGLTLFSTPNKSYTKAPLLKPINVWQGAVSKHNAVLVVNIYMEYQGRAPGTQPVLKWLWNWLQKPQLRYNVNRRQGHGVTVLGGENSV